MQFKSSAYLPVVFLCFMTLCLDAVSQDKVETTISQFSLPQATDAKGHELRAQSDQLFNLLRDKKIEIAKEKALAIEKAYQALFSKNVAQYSFHDAADLLEFKKTHTENIEWIDWGYVRSLQAQGFIAIEQKEFEKAISILKRIEIIAPASANAKVELGYIFNQQGKSKEALGYYQKALELSEQYPSQSTFKASALRGMAYSFVELNRLDDAEKTYMTALELDPDNKITLAELKYIAERKKQAMEQ